MPDRKQGYLTLSPDFAQGSKKPANRSALGGCRQDRRGEKNQKNFASVQPAPCAPAGLQDRASDAGRIKVSSKKGFGVRRMAVDGYQKQSNLQAWQARPTKCQTKPGLRCGRAGSGVSAWQACLDMMGFTTHPRTPRRIVQSD